MKADPRSTRRIAATLLLVAILVAPAVAVVSHGSRAGKQPVARYAADRIVVAFAKDVTVSAKAPGKPVTGLAEVDSLNARFDVSRMEPVFRGLAARKASASGLARQLANTYAVTFAAKADPKQVAQAYAKLPQVRYAEPDGICRADRTDPDDPFWTTSGSWGQSYRDQWDMEIMRMPEAWDMGTGSASITVAVLDTGIDYNHSDIAPNMWQNPGEVAGNGVDDDGNGYVDDVMGYDFAYRDSDPMDGYGHGTHVAGTIGAVGNNGLGIAGINWTCSLMAVKGLSDTGTGSYTDLAAGIVYAADEGARVVNMSWGGSGFSRLIHDALAYAHSHDVVLCASAGNSYQNIAFQSPAMDNYVITVAASDENDQTVLNQWWGSNWGIKVAVAAPGGNGDAEPPCWPDMNILSLRAEAWGDDPGCPLTVGGDYLRLGGTSMACPHVSGLAALLLAMYPDGTNEQIRQAIQMRAQDIMTPGFDRFSGFGRVDAFSTVTTFEPMTAFVSDPRNGTWLNGEAGVYGSAFGPTLSDWVLDYGMGFEPGSWTTIATGSAPVVNGMLGSWNTTGQPRGRCTLRLRTNGTGEVQNAEYRLEVILAGNPDECEGATVIDALPFEDFVSSYEATESPTDPMIPCLGGPGYNTVWYRYTPAESGRVIVDTIGSYYDTVVAVWSGTCSSPSPVACDDESGGGGTSRAMFEATAGTPYMIEVASPADGGGWAVVHVTPFAGDYFTQQFDSEAFDLQNISLDFSPAASADFYSACKTPITSLPTDPSGGVGLELEDDDYAQVDLSDGKQVSIYGNSYASFYVGSNGYITFDAGDGGFNESFGAHFALKRVSALFNDLNPEDGGEVSYQQLDDRVAVTFLDVPEYGEVTTNTFQIEVFFDGRIVISYLNIAAAGALAGLSAGDGVPAGFSESDLSAYGICGIGPGAGPVNESLDPATAMLQSGAPLSMTTTYSHTDGADKIADCQVLFGPTLSGVNAAYLRYDPAADKLYLRNAANSDWLGGFAPGSEIDIENGICVLHCEGTSVAPAGSNNIEIAWSLTLNPVAAGSAKGWMYVTDQSGHSDGWDEMGCYWIDAAATMSINAGAECSTAAEVTLGLDSDGAAEMRFRDDPGDWSAWEPYASARLWTLPAGEGTRRVCAQVRDSCLQELPEVCDDIHLDTVAPSDATVSINAGANCVSSHDVMLTLAATGADEMRFRNEDGPWSDWEAYGAAKEWTLTAGGGTRTVGFQCRDACGNLSEEASDAVTVPTFNDVTCSHPQLSYIEALVAAGVTSGCSASPPLYCPFGTVTRAQMAKFLCLAAGKEPLIRVIPTFADVPPSLWAYGWVERLADGPSWGGTPPTGGCRIVGGLKYFCPFDNVTREQMAKFIVVAAGKQPMPGCYGVFADVAHDAFCPYIERMADASSWPTGIAVTDGCICPGGVYPPGSRCYCPKANVTRAQMAVFLVRAFALDR